MAVLTVQAVPISAKESAVDPTLGERIRNMDAEVQRFSSLESPGSDGLGLHKETPPSNEDHQRAVRARLRSLERGTEIRVVLQGGDIVQGRLLELTDDAFYLNVPLDEIRVVRREYGFDEVKDVEYPGSTSRSP